MRGSRPLNARGASERSLSQWSRLTAAFFLIGLATSRLSLVLHELVGHGGAAVLMGGRLVDYRLFLFGGGWVRTESSGPQRDAAFAIAVSMAGIALEIAAAAAALAIAARLRRRRAAPLAQLALVGFATADLLHAGFYFAVGTYHGFGDGRALHAALGAARAWLVWPSAIGVAFAAFLLARRLTRLTFGWVAARSRAGRALALISATLVAALAHGALTWSERRMTGDAIYSRIMQPEGERRLEREVARRAAEARRQGGALGEDELAALRSELERRERRLPLGAILAGALVLACGFGVWRGLASSSGDDEREARAPPWRALARLAAAAGAALALVAALERFSPKTAVHGSADQPARAEAVRRTS